uniref:Acetyl-CoA carboxylase biotin carboxylase subunit n=1 Tax=candidate division WOR-3 bacterium TaxID=2052148 RepID=A0A7V3PSM6_UNCW3
MFKKVLVAARAIPALRVIRTCRELGIRCVVPYSEADRDSLPVLLADEAVCIGPAPASASYANSSRLLAAAEVTSCEALHPGWGFLSSEPEFADATINSGIIFVGPTPGTLRQLRDRLALRQILKDNGIPVVMASEVPITNPQQAVAESARLGLPVVVKPVLSNLNITRLIVKEKDIEYQVRMCQAETRAHTGSEQVYLEKYLTGARPVDVLLISYLPIIDWEVGFYYRHRDIIAFSPANITSKLRTKIYRWAKLALTALQFNGCSVVRFLIDERENPYLFRINCELSPFSPLAEISTGIDIVAEQLRVATGIEAEKAPRSFQVGALAVNIFAEDPYADFEPCTGILAELTLPGGPFIRVESHLYPGTNIPPDYEPHIASVFSWGLDFQNARGRLQRALAEFNTGNIRTDLDLIRAALRHPEFGKPGGIVHLRQPGIEIFA